MPFDRFLITPFQSGLQTDMRPWQILEDSFTFLQNAYTFRGRVRKRDGSTLMGTVLQSRLAINIGTVTTHTIPNGATQLKIGQLFTVGNDQFTVWQLGAGVTTLSSNPGATATINSTTNPNTITFTGEPGGSTVFYYPSNPVMGLTQYYVGSTNNHPSYAFDTQFAYLFTPGVGWNRSGTAIWHGNNLNYFWATNWESIAGDIVLYVTNFNATVPTPAATDDPIWYMTRVAGVDTWTAAIGANAFYFLPDGGAVHTGPFVATARIIVPFHNRLVLLNTIENDGTGGGGVNTAFVNRARFSWYGDPTAVNAWYEWNQSDASGNNWAGGGYRDAATTEQIISAEFIKDHLVVYMERSTWELVFTNDETDPFLWQQLNTELGSMATFSTVPFDQQILTIGQSGVHSCNGSNVQRIDQKIPDLIFEFETKNNGQLRTHGIRDYYTELVYWSYVATNARPTTIFPNQLLVYNYQNNSFAKSDDCFTCFGYYEQNTDTTWISSAPDTWEEFDGTWVSNAFQANHRQVIAGTPEGFVLIINADVTRNAASMQITNIIGTTGLIDLTIVNHNLTFDPTENPSDQDYIYIENIIGDLATTVLNGKIFQVYFVVNVNTITIDIGKLVIGTYLGGGTAARVSNIQLTTKQFNPYDKQDRNVYIHKMSFGIQRQGDFSATIQGPQITVDYSPSATPISMIEDAQATGTIMGTSILEMTPYNPIYYPLESQQERLWHPIYFQSDGECIQLRFYMSAQQMEDPIIAFADFELEGMIMYANPTASRME